MGLTLYNFSVRSYVAFVRALSPFNKKAKQFTDGRNDLFERMGKAFEGNVRPVFWLHAASLGEFEQGRPVMEAYRRHFPEHRILLTFYSPSGYEVRKNYTGADDIFYLPADSRSNARRFYEIVRPDTGVIVKYEFWYHYIDQAPAFDVNLISISTILRPGHFLLKKKGRFLAECIRNFDHFFTQDEVTADLLNSIEISKVSVAGDTRYDRVAEIAAGAGDIEVAGRFLNGTQAMVIGSSWPSDMEKLYPVISAFSDKMKFIIAPHNIHENEITAIEKTLEESTCRFSEAVEQKDPADCQVLIVDNIGMLSSLYRYGNYAYVGGAFRGALHNTLEAAVYGIPVFFGKHPANAKFLEAGDLVSQGGAFEIETSEELISLIDKMENNAEIKKAAGSASAKWVQNSGGATETIINYLKNRQHK